VQPALRAVDVSKTFAEQRVLNRVSLEIRPGEVHALLGENGSGKSTLIKIFSGFHRPDPGSEVYVGDRRLPFGSAAASFAAGLRFVHQRLAVIPEFNAVENIGLEAGYRRRWFINWRDQVREAERLIALLNVDMDVWKPLEHCRPVEQSAVAIARALRGLGTDKDGGGVRLVVLDEPTALLPEAEVKELFGLVRRVAAAGVGALYVTHRLDEVFELADRVSVLRDGELQGTETVDDSLTRDRLVELIVGRRLAARRETAAAQRRAVDGEAGAPALEVNDLAAGRLRGVSLTVHRGEVVGVIGIEGSGREDLARAVVGATKAETGSVAVDGTPLRSLSPRQAAEHGVLIGLSNSQTSGGAVSDFSIRENVTLGSLSRHRRLGCIRRRSELGEARRWIEGLDIRPPLPDFTYRRLSGGNQQKVILARCLNSRPHVLVLDQPTAGVDVGARQSIYELIAAQAGQGLAVLLCSSDAEDMLSVCDRALIVWEGRIAAELRGDALTEENILVACSTGSPAGVGA
jgi:ribose transport system ATP-binding protein